MNTYEAPAIEELGSIEELTLGQGDGNFLDKKFPVNTPKKKLTFS